MKFSASILISFSILFAGPIFAQDQVINFANKLCSAWNASSLPAKLAAESAGGSGWIDVVTGVQPAPAGTQILASGRYDCNVQPEYALTIQKDQSGKAMCVKAEIFKGSRTWKFLPKTSEYNAFAKSFGMGAFYSLWSNGMEGNKGTAWSNSEHFQTFFQLAVQNGGEYLKPNCAK